MSTPPLSILQACERIGKKVPDWTQGAGGNVSLKEGNLLWIKASGARLDRVAEPRGMALVSLSAFRKGVDEMPEEVDQAEIAYADLLKLSSIEAPNLGRPSMETGFHSLLPGRWVFHFHSLVSMAMGHQVSLEGDKLLAVLESQWGEKISLVEAVRPGWLLSKTLEEKSKQGATAFLLKNHGTVLQAEGPEVLDRWEALEAYFCQRQGFSLKPTSHEERWEGKFRLLFPDVAVFKDRLEKVLEETSHSLFRLQKEAWEKDADMAEIWVAVQKLAMALPEISDLPYSIASTVAQLPTEKVRQKEKA